ncbi:MAG: hypothetical protein GY948_16840 [Alphaproteobacteria bacterium]|nr:hypothetical protein [Alphaproteobacteria bacterium]
MSLILRIVFDVILGTFPVTTFTTVIGAGVAGHNLGPAPGIVCGLLVLIAGGVLEGRVSGWDWTEGRNIVLGTAWFVFVMALVALLVIPIC